MGFENLRLNITVNGENHELWLVNTVSEENKFPDLRRGSYSKADVVFVCFNIMNRQSYDNVEKIVRKNFFF